jgi:hypothetical protein
METIAQTIPVSKTKLWISWIITALIALFLFFDAVAKIVMVDQVVEATARLGYSQTSVYGIGLTLFICTVLYVIPKTSVLGAILLTAYLGGATNTHVRIGEPFYFPVVFGILIWLSVYLRNRELRNLIPIIR